MSISNGSYHIVSQEYNMLLGVRPNGDSYAVAQSAGTAQNTVWTINVRQPSPLTVSFCCASTETYLTAERDKKHISSRKKVLNRDTDVWTLEPHQHGTYVLRSMFGRYLEIERDGGISTSRRASSKCAVRLEPVDLASAFVPVVAPTAMPPAQVNTSAMPAYAPGNAPAPVMYNPGVPQPPAQPWQQQQQQQPVRPAAEPPVYAAAASAPMPPQQQLAPGAVGLPPSSEYADVLDLIGPDTQPPQYQQQYQQQAPPPQYRQVYSQYTQY